MKAGRGRGAAGEGAAGTGAVAKAPRVERGRQFWTVENLTSAPFLLILSTALLCVIGLVMIFSASSIEAVEDGNSAIASVRSQAIYLVVAVILCAMVRKMGSGTFWLETMFLILWIAVVLLLLAVLVVGDDSHGATRWLRLGPLSLQPSEFAKIALIMAAARLLAAWERDAISTKLLLWYMLIFIGAPFVLILLQKDLGTLLIVAGTIFLMAVLSGVKARYLVGIIVLGVAAVAALIWVAPYRMGRFTTWLDPEADYYGDGWQIIHGLYAFASGGLFGLGIGNSRQKYSYLPEAENDYIFAIIGEELGFVGAFVVIALFVVWGVSGWRIAAAARERSRASFLMASGMTIIILVQALLNMCGVLQILPLSGRPLPFISSGGSSLVASLITVGLLLCVSDDNDLALSTARSSSRSNLVLLEGGSGPGAGQGPGSPGGRRSHDAASASRSPREPRGTRETRGTGRAGVATREAGEDARGEAGSPRTRARRGEKQRNELLDEAPAFLTRRSPDRQERAARTGRTGSTGSTGRTERTDGTERADREERTGRAARSDRSDRVERSGRTDRTERAERSDRTSRRTESSGSERSRSDRTDRSDRSDRTDRRY